MAGREARIRPRTKCARAAWFVVLHDRRIPGSRADIDHIVIAPAGVFVIDAKRYKGNPHLRVIGGLFRQRP